MFLMSQQMASKGINELLDFWDITSHTCSVVVTSGEQASQSMASILWSSACTLWLHEAGLCCATLQRHVCPYHHWPATKPVMLYDVTDSITFTAAFPGSFTLVTCAQFEPALHPWQSCQFRCYLANTKQAVSQQTRSKGILICRVIGW